MPFKRDIILSSDPGRTGAGGGEGGERKRNGATPIRNWNYVRLFRWYLTLMVLLIFRSLGDRWQSLLNCNVVQIVRFIPGFPIRSTPTANFFFALLNDRRRSLNGKLFRKGGVN